MENQNIDQLRKLAKVFNADKVITTDEIQEVLKGIMQIMSSFKKENESLTSETKQIVNGLLNKILDENDKLHETVSYETSTHKEEMMIKMDKSIKEMQVMCEEMMTRKPMDGKDADEEIIVDKVLAKIQLPESTILDTPTQLRDKLETLEGEDRLDAKFIKGLENLLKKGKGKTTEIIASGIRFLNQLADVRTTNLQNNDALVWDATNLVWKNATSASSDEKVKYDIADPTAGYVADKIISGTGISVAEGTGGNENKLVVTNSAPDQTVAITGSGAATVTGTYPNFNVAVTASGTGDVVGPVSATDNALARFDTTTGKLIQNSTVTLADDGIFENVNAIKLDITPSSITPTIGQIYWDAADQTAAINVDTGVTLQLGQEEYIRVVNKTGVQINDGEVVRVSGAQGNRPTAVLAQSNTFNTSVVIGVATQNIAINGEGFVTTHGVVNGFDTSVFSGAGAYLYLDSVTPGKLTDNVGTPVPAFVVPVAVALNQTNNGAIFVSPFYPRSTDGTLAGNSNSYSPSEKAIKTYADTKVASNGAISASTKTKITYDTKGLVTSGADATTADIADSLNKRYVTDANLTVIGNTSGTNSGDNATNTTYEPAKIFTVDIGRYGFLNRTETTISFNGTKTFTLAKVGANWSYYRTGVKYTITANKTVDLVAGTPVDGTLYYIYLDSTDGTLTCDTGGWTLADTKVPVATVYWNNTLTPKFIMADERHTVGIDRAYHREHHFTEGTEVQNSGTLSGLVAASTTPADKTFGYASAAIFDEDLKFNISTLTDPDGATAVYPVLYRTSATTYAWEMSDMPFKYTTSAGPTYGYIEYDLNGTSTPESTNNRYLNTYIFLSNAVANAEANPEISTSPQRFFIMQGRAFYTSAALAAAEKFVVSAGMPVAEGVAVWQLTWRQNGEPNTVKGRCTYVSAQQINTNVTVSSLIPTTLHNDLAGIDGGEIGYYGHLTSAQHTGLTTLTASEIVGSNASGNLTSLAVATYPSLTELAYVKGVTSAVQTQLNAKLPLAGGTMTGKVVSAGRSEVAKTYTPATGSQTVALDASVNNMHVVTGHADGTAITFTITGMTDSQPIIVSILQGANTPSTIAGWFSTVRWAGGSAPTLTATVNKRDTFGFIRTGSNTYDGFIIGQAC